MAELLLTAINAKYIHSNLAVYSLKANAHEYASDVEICEYTINHREEEILSSLYEKKPKCVGFSCYLWNVEYTFNLAKNLKKILPEVLLVVGGPEVSYRPEKILEETPYIDAIMVGEGEKTFYEFMKWLKEGKEKEEWQNIDGLVYRIHNEIHRTKPRQGLDMDDLVFPYKNLEGMENRILYYESIRGCPFSCSYCLSSIEKSVRIKSLEKTKREIDFFLEHKVPQVKFVDRTFNCNHDHAYGVWKYIGEHDNGITNFHFEISGDLLREEDFLLLEHFRPGLVQFEIGVQSTNPDTIRAIRRTMNLTKLQSNIEKVRKNRNIHQHLDLIAGLPYEDYESFKTSFNDVYAMKPDQLQLGFLKVLDGSYMNEAKDEYGVIYNSRPPYEVFATQWISYEEILKLKQVEEMVEVYYNSFQFSATMTYLTRYFENPFSLYQALGEYYKKNQLFDVKHSRLARYEILWDFISARENIDETAREDFRETLTYDLYSRDYVKNPPAFVLERTKERKDEVRGFFDRELEEPKYLKEYEGYATKQLFNLVYMNVFTMDMEMLITTGERKEEETYYLFDYRKRDPLSYSATITKVFLK